VEKYITIKGCTLQKKKYIKTCITTRDSSVGIALGYGLDYRGYSVRFQAGASIYSKLQILSSTTFKFFQPGYRVYKYLAQSMHPGFSIHTRARECVTKSLRTGSLERELQMVQLSATRCNFIAILWVSLVSYAAITLCVATQQVFIFISLSTQSGNFRIHPCVCVCVCVCVRERERHRKRNMSFSIRFCKTFLARNNEPSSSNQATQYPFLEEIFGRQRASKLFSWY
jgi:hypothetical protein